MGSIDWRSMAGGKERWADDLVANEVQSVVEKLIGIFQRGGMISMEEFEADVRVLEQSADYNRICNVAKDVLVSRMRASLLVRRTAIVTESDAAMLNARNVVTDVLTDLEQLLASAEPGQVAIRMSQCLYRKMHVDLESSAEEPLAERNLVVARRLYSEWYGYKLGRVTKRTLQDDWRGLTWWLNQARKQHSVRVQTDGEELQATAAMEPGAETVAAIFKVLTQRKQYLDAKGLPEDAVLTEVQKQEVMKRLKQEFALHPLELELDDANRKEGYSETQVRGMRRSRFCRDQQRRVGSRQMFLCLMFTGRCRVPDLRSVEGGGSAHTQWL